MASQGVGGESNGTFKVSSLPQGSTTEWKTFNIRAELTPPKKSRAFNVYDGVRKLINRLFQQTALQVFDHSRSTFFDNMDSFPSTGEEFAAHFRFETKPFSQGNPKVLVLIKVQSQTSLGVIKRDREFTNFLRTNEIKLYTHELGSLQISKIAFLTDWSPRLSWHPKVKQDLIDEITAANKGFATTIPQFEVLSTKVRYFYKNDGEEKTRRLEVDALEIQCATQDARHLLKLLTHDEMSLSQRVIPYQLRRSHPDLFKNQILRQKEYMSTLKCIPVFGIDASLFNEIHHSRDETVYNLILTAPHGKKEVILSIEPTTQTATLGKYFFLCHASMEKRAHRIIDVDLPQYYAGVRMNDLSVVFPDYPNPTRVGNQYLRDQAHRLQDATHSYNDIPSTPRKPARKPFKLLSEPSPQTSSPKKSPKSTPSKEATPTTTPKATYASVVQQTDNNLLAQLQQLQEQNRLLAKQVALLTHELQELKNVKRQDMASKIASAIATTPKHTTKYTKTSENTKQASENSPDRAWQTPTRKPPGSPRKLTLPETLDFDDFEAYEDTTNE